MRKFDILYEETLIKNMTDEMFIECLLSENLDEGILNSIFNKLGDAQRFVQAGINKLKKTEKKDTEQIVKGLIQNYKKHSEFIDMVKNMDDETKVDKLIDKVVEIGDETLPMPALQADNKNKQAKLDTFQTDPKIKKIFKALFTTKYSKTPINIEYRLTLAYVLLFGQLNFDTVSNVGSNKKKMNIKPGIPIK